MPPPGPSPGASHRLSLPCHPPAIFSPAQYRGPLSRRQAGTASQARSLFPGVPWGDPGDSQGMGWAGEPVSPPCSCPPVGWALPRPSRAPPSTPWALPFCPELGPGSSVDGATRVSGSSQASPE